MYVETQNMLQVQIVLVFVNHATVMVNVSTVLTDMIIKMNAAQVVHHQMDAVAISATAQLHVKWLLVVMVDAQLVRHALAPLIMHVNQ
jgi:hypothetical protein